MGYVSSWVTLGAMVSMSVFFYLLASLAYPAAGNTRFDQFFPVYNSYFTNIRDVHCASLYALQQVDYTNKSLVTGPCPALLSCILESTSEAVKGDMTGATILLGLLPTMLVSLSSDVYETALLSRRRPLLAFLLACGSPAVEPVRSFKHPDVMSHLRVQEKSSHSYHLSRCLEALPSTVLVVLEYCIAIGAFANVFITAIYAGLQTINAVACNISYCPLLWVGCNILIHWASLLALSLQAEETGSQSPRLGLARYLHVLRREFTLCVRQEALGPLLKVREGSVWFTLWWWFASAGTVAYVMYGTLTFSSLLLIGK